MARSPTQRQAGATQTFVISPAAFHPTPSIFNKWQKQSHLHSLLRLRTQVHLRVASADENNIKSAVGEMQTSCQIESEGRGERARRGGRGGDPLPTESGGTNSIESCVCICSCELLIITSCTCCSHSFLSRHRPLGSHPSFKPGEAGVSPRLPPGAAVTSQRPRPVLF